MNKEQSSPSKLSAFDEKLGGVRIYRGKSQVLANVVTRIINTAEQAHRTREKPLILVNLVLSAILQPRIFRLLPHFPKTIAQCFLG